MVTKQDVFRLLEECGVKHDDTVTIHASLRSAGPIMGGADGLIDALKEYLCDGLLLIPTHTWANVNRQNPVFDVRKTVPCIGTLARIAAFRPDAVRTLHPTHSLAIFGKGAWEYAQGEEKSGTPAPMGGCLSRLYEREGKILLLGVGHERNTYLHAVDERIDVPNRLHPDPFTITIIDWDGKEHQSPLYRPHHVENIRANLGCSDYYPNYKKAIEAAGAVVYGQLGTALVYCCDAKKMTDAVIRLWQHADRDMCIEEMEIPESWY